MKILIINSSYRKKGNTYQILELLQRYILDTISAKNLKAEIEYLSLADRNLSVCRGCRFCFDKGEEMCPLKDDLLLIRDKMLSADGIILAAPVYVEDVNGVMKNWIDRMAFYCHRPAFFSRNALVITTSGGGSTKHSLNTMKKALSSWGYIISGQRNFRMGAAKEAQETEILYNKELREIAENFIISMKKKEAFKPSLFAYIIFRVQQKYWLEHSNQSMDYKYWESNGWLEPDTYFYMKNKIIPVKSVTGRFFGNLVSKFFI